MRKSYGSLPPLFHRNCSWGIGHRETLVAFEALQETKAIVLGASGVHPTAENEFPQADGRLIAESRAASVQPREHTASCRR